MSEPSSKARRLFEDAHGFDMPTQADQDRIAKKLARHLGAAALLTGASASAAVAGTAPGVAVGTFTVTKIVLAAAVIVIAGAGITGAFVIRAHHKAPATPAARIARVIHSESESTAVAPIVTEPESAPEITEIPTFNRAPSASTRSHTSRPASSTDTLQSEIVALGAAQAALREGHASTALTLLDQYATTFPRGHLQQESRVSRVLALCAAGQRDRARAEAARFRRESPHSPLMATIRASCAQATHSDGSTN